MRRRPLRSWENIGDGINNKTALACDVSGSMTSVLQTPAMHNLLGLVVATERPRELVALDTKVAGRWAASETEFVELLQTGGGSTALKAPLVELLAVYDKAILITDADGFSGLYDLNVASHPLQAYAPPGIEICICSKTDPE